MTMNSSQWHALKGYCGEMIDMDDPTYQMIVPKEEAQADLIAAMSNYIEKLEAEVGVSTADYQRAHEEVRREREEEEQAFA